MNTSLLVSLSLSLSIALSLVLGGPALAKEYPTPDGKAAVYAPDGFSIKKAKDGSEGVLIATSKAEDCVFMYAAVKGENLDQAVAAFDKIIDRVVKGAKADKAEKTTLNGMPALAVVGSGTAAGKPVTIAAVVVQTTPTHALVVVGIVETAKKAQYKPELKKVLASIRRS